MNSFTSTSILNLSLLSNGSEKGQNNSLGGIFSLDINNKLAENTELEFAEILSSSILPAESLSLLGRGSLHSIAEGGEAANISALQGKVFPPGDGEGFTNGVSLTGGASKIKHGQVGVDPSLLGKGLLEETGADSTGKNATEKNIDGKNIIANGNSLLDGLQSKTEKATLSDQMISANGVKQALHGDDKLIRQGTNLNANEELKMRHSNIDSIKAGLTNGAKLSKEESVAQAELTQVFGSDKTEKNKHSVSPFTASLKQENQKEGLAQALIKAGEGKPGEVKNSDVKVVDFKNELSNSSLHKADTFKLDNNLEELAFLKNENRINSLFADKQNSEQMLANKLLRAARTENHIFNPASVSHSAKVESPALMQELSPISQPAAELKAAELPVTQKLQAGSEFNQGLNLKKDFSPNLAMRIQWMFKQALSSAEIMMDPPEMGPLSVKVQQHNGETNIMFQVSNASTREALEENLPKLKEMLQQQGINMGEASVKQDGTGDQSDMAETDKEGNDGGVNGEGESVAEEAVTEEVGLVTDKLVDVYS
ncbi:flagellar hook-length control protein FliK [Aliikangiella coralliicola]|nr:flagellar hook-length control protein FliK [Aliikangiella coralliicola]